MMSHALTTTCPLKLMDTADKEVTERATGECTMDEKFKQGHK